MPALVYISALLACYKPCRDQETGTLSLKPYNMIMVALVYLFFVTWVQQVVLQRGASPAPSESRYWLPCSIFLSIRWGSRLPYLVTCWEGKKSRRWQQRQNSSELLSSCIGKVPFLPWEVEMIDEQLRQLHVEAELWRTKRGATENFPRAPSWLHRVLFLFPGCSSLGWHMDLACLQMRACSCWRKIN